MKDIHEKVDSLLAGNHIRKTNMKQKKLNKKLLLGIGAVLIGGMLVTGLGVADLFDWFAIEGTTVESGVMLTWDDQDAEELTVSKTISDATGGNIYSFNHYLNLSSNADSNRTVSFSWENVPEGITTNLTVNGEEINFVTIEPGESILIVENFILDDKLEAMTYSNINLTLS